MLCFLDIERSKNKGQTVNISSPSLAVQKHPCGVISGPYIHEKSLFRTAQAIQKWRKGHIKYQRISDLKLLKTWVLAHFVCISCRLDHVAASVSTSFSVVKTCVFIPIPCEIHFATGERFHAQHLSYFSSAFRTHLWTIVCLFWSTGQ